MSPLDRHLTTEQLSALLDHQLSPEDTEEGYQAHLQTCEQCQQELAELRQTVQILRELPPPPLPRSFTLPITTTLEPAEEEDEPATARPISIATRRQARSARREVVRTALRMVSGLVAVIGFGFVLIGLLTALGHGGVTATSGSTATGYSAPRQSAESASPNAASTDPHTALTPTPTPTPYMQPAHNQSSSGSTTAQTPPIFPFIDINMAPGRFGLGILLAILGSMGFALFKQRYRP